MTSSFRMIRNTLFWMLVALLILGFVLVSPSLVPSEAKYAPSSSKSVTIAKDSNGKWGAIKNGKIDKTVTTVAKNKYGWWYVNKGYVDFSYTGIKQNEFGWWRIAKGKADFKATGLYSNEYGWWRVENGKVDFNANGVYKNAGRWWYVKNGKVDFSFTGVGSNRYGQWYIKNGQFDSSKNGDYTWNGTTYYVVNGKCYTITDRMTQAKADAKALVKEVPCSRTMLIDFLTDEDIGYNYTNLEANYGVDHANIDFKLQAVLVAADQVDEDGIGCSKKMLESILNSYEFTDEEVAYAMEQCSDVNWDEQALLTAKFFQKVAKEDGKTYTKEYVQKALVDELYYTESEAQYAVDHLTW